MNFKLIAGQNLNTYDDMLISLKYNIFIQSFIIFFILVNLDFNSVNKFITIIGSNKLLKNIENIQNWSLYISLPFVLSIIWFLINQYFLLNLEMFLWTWVLRQVNKIPKFKNFGAHNTILLNLNIPNIDKKKTFYKYTNFDSKEHIGAHYINEAFANLSLLWSILNSFILSILITIVAIGSKNSKLFFVYIIIASVCLVLSFYREHIQMKIAKKEVDAILDLKIKGEY